jgi:hypothetical protein
VPNWPLKANLQAIPSISDCPVFSHP